jgi:hypothetical protein
VGVFRWERRGDEVEVGGEVLKCWCSGVGSDAVFGFGAPTVC